MSGAIHRHIRSNVVGYVAMFMALTSGAYAAGQIGAGDIGGNAVRSKHIKNGQVKNADLGPGAVDASKVTDNSLGGNQIDESTLDPAVVQMRVNGTCAGSQSVQSIAADGSVACGAPAGSGTVTQVGTGTGLAGGPITSSGTVSLASSYRLPQSCANNQVAKSNGAGVWNCAADLDTNTTYTAAANGGLALNAGAFALNPCSSGQILKSTGPSTWGCAADNAGGPPTGAAGGDLAGTYPSPTIATGAVSTTELSFDPATQTELNTVTGQLSGAGTINQAGNPIDWTKLKNVPSGIADGTDANSTYTAGSGLKLTGSTFSTDNVYGTVLANGATDSGVHLTSTSRLGLGQYEFFFDRSVNGCAHIAQLLDIPGITKTIAGIRYRPDTDLDRGSKVRVDQYNTAGSLADGAVTLVAICP